MKKLDKVCKKTLKLNKAILSGNSTKSRRRLEKYGVEYLDVDMISAACDLGLGVLVGACLYGLCELVECALIEKKVEYLHKLRELTPDHRYHTVRRVNDSKLTVDVLISYLRENIADDLPRYLSGSSLVNDELVRLSLAIALSDLPAATGRSWSNYGVVSSNTLSLVSECVTLFSSKPAGYVSAHREWACGRNDFATALRSIIAAPKAYRAHINIETVTTLASNPYARYFDDTLVVDLMIARCYVLATVLLSSGYAENYYINPDGKVFQRVNTPNLPERITTGLTVATSVSDMLLPETRGPVTPVETDTC